MINETDAKNIINIVLKLFALGRDYEYFEHFLNQKYILT